MPYSLPHPLLEVPLQYDFKSQANTFVNGQRSTQKTHLQLRSTLTYLNARQQYFYCVEQLRCHYESGPRVAVLAELAQSLNRRLCVVTDESGYLSELDGQAALYQQWRYGHEREAFLKKHRANPHTGRFMADFEQGLQNPVLVEQMRHKGHPGVLFPGVLGVAHAHSVRKRLTDYLGPGLDLPLLVEVAVVVRPDGCRQVETNGRLDEAAFDGPRFRRLIRQMVDAPNYPVELEVGYRERYVVEPATGRVLSGGQHLRAMVQGVYLSEVIHELTLSAC